MRRTTLAAVVAGAAVAALGAAASAPAIVPPKDCKTITVKHHRYNIKADQLPCSQAKTYATRYLKSNTRPPGYKCTRYKGSALVARLIPRAREIETEAAAGLSAEELAVVKRCLRRIYGNMKGRPAALRRVG